MSMFADVPFVPIIALLIIIPLVSWQIYNYWVYRQKNQKPNIPDINKKAISKSNHQAIKNATLLKTLKPQAKVARRTSLLFTSAVGIFVLVNLLVLTFYLRNRKLTYLPRADETLTPTSIITTQISPSTTPVLTAGPTLLAGLAGSPTLPLTTNTPIPTRQITATPTSSVTIMPTATKALPSPTARPTLLAGGPYGMDPITVTPTAKPTAKLSVTPTARPTVISAVPSIPETGIGTSSLFLAGLSLVFLIIGLAL